MQVQVLVVVTMSLPDSGVRLIHLWMNPRSGGRKADRPAKIMLAMVAPFSKSAALESEYVVIPTSCAHPMCPFPYLMTILGRVLFYVYVL